LFEPVLELEGLGIEQGKLLLHRDCEVLTRFERFVGGSNLLVRAQSLLVSHFTSVNEAMRASTRARTAPAAARPPKSSSSVRASRGGPPRRARPASREAGRAVLGASPRAHPRPRLQSS